MASPVKNKELSTSSINQRRANYHPASEPTLQSSSNQPADLRCSGLPGGGGGGGGGPSRAADIRQNVNGARQVQGAPNVSRPAQFSRAHNVPPSGGQSSYMPFTTNYFYSNQLPAPRSSTYHGSLIDFAQGNSASVFNSVARGIYAVGSVTNMLDSIFMNCTGCFNAALSTINELYQLKNHFARVMSAFTVLNSIRWLYARLLQWLGLRSRADVDEAWANAQRHSSRSSTAPKVTDDSFFWSRRTFVTIMLCSLAGLVWRLLQFLNDLDQSRSGDGSNNRGGRNEQSSSDGNPRRTEIPGNSSSDPNYNGGPSIGGYIPSNQYNSMGGLYGGTNAMYGTAPTVYGNTSAGLYNSRTRMYGAPAGTYGALAGTYGAPAGTYGALAGTYGVPAGAFGAPAGAFGAPAGAYGAPAGAYGAPAGSYGSSVGAYGTYIPNGNQFNSMHEMYSQQIPAGYRTTNRPYTQQEQQQEHRQQPQPAESTHRQQASPAARRTDASVSSTDVDSSNSQESFQFSSEPRIDASSRVIDDDVKK